MSWRRVSVIYACLAILVAYLMLFERSAPPPDAEPSPTAASSLLGIDASSVTGAVFRRGERVVRAAYTHGRWRVVDPPNTPVSPDLIDATIATLTEGQASEELVQDPEGALATFGLDVPAASVELVTTHPADAPLTVLVGDRNPTQTAVYARRSDRPSIFLVGMNLRYYLDLIIDAAYP